MKKILKIQLILTIFFTILCFIIWDLETGLRFFLITLIILISYHLGYDDGMTDEVLKND